MRRRLLLLIPFLFVPLGGCGGLPASNRASARLRVVAAENFWGSLSEQLGGSKVSVHSIIVNPATDPHSYEPAPADARALASARLVIVNGVGYDPWALQLIGANPAEGQIVLNVGALFSLRQGDNPHRWYDPAEVEAVALAITADLKKLDPSNASYYDLRSSAFEHRGLAPYHRLIAMIRARYGGVPVGASESIFSLQARALGLRLISPYRFMKAISEGAEVSAQDTTSMQRQITHHEIKLWVYNSQNVTPAIERLNALARAAKIPSAAVTETLSPTGQSFQQWQVDQLQEIARGLHRGTGR